MMLARDYAQCHAAKSTLVTRVANNVHKLRCLAKKSGFKSYRPLIGPIETQGAHPLQLNLRQLMRVIHQMCAAIPHQYIHRHIDISMSTRYLSVDETPGGGTKY